MSEQTPTRKQLTALLDRIEAARQNVKPRPTIARPFDLGSLDIGQAGDRILACRRLAERFGFEWHDLAKMSEAAITDLFQEQARKRAAQMMQRARGFSRHRRQLVVRGRSGADSDPAYPASWYHERTGGVLDAEKLRQAYHDRRIRARKGNGNRNHYYLSSVRTAYPEVADKLE